MVNEIIGEMQEELLAIEEEEDFDMVFGIAEELYDAELIDNYDYTIIRSYNVSDAYKELYRILFL